MITGARSTITKINKTVAVDVKILHFALATISHRLVAAGHQVKIVLLPIGHKARYAGCDLVYIKINKFRTKIFWMVYFRTLISFACQTNSL